jgi:hypothetical protein
MERSTLHHGGCVSGRESEKKWLIDITAKKQARQQQWEQTKIVG